MKIIYVSDNKIIILRSDPLMPLIKILNSEILNFNYPYSTVPYLTNNATLGINKIFITFFCIIFHLDFHAFFPQALGHSISYPKPNKSFLCYSSTINSSTYRTTVVLSSTFWNETCTTLDKKYQEKVETNNIDL